MRNNHIAGLSALFVALLLVSTAFSTTAKNGTVWQELRNVASETVSRIVADSTGFLAYFGISSIPIDMVSAREFVMKFAGVVLLALLILAVLIFLAAWRIGIYKNEPEKPAF